MATPETTRTPVRFGTHGRVLIVDLTTKTSRVEEIDESVYRSFLGGYGLGAWLMWKHFPAGHRPARARGVLRDRLGPAHRRCARRSRGASRSSASRRSPARGPTRTRAAACAATCATPATTRCVVTRQGRASRRVLVVRDGEVHVRARRRAVGPGDPARRSTRCARASAASARSACSAIGPAGEQQRAHRVGDERPLPRVRPPGLRRDLRQQEPEGDRRRRHRRGADRRARRASRRSARRSPTSTRATSRWSMRVHGRGSPSRSAGSAGCTG